jgi:hypothetical protein
MTQAMALTDLDWAVDAHEVLLKVAAEGKPFTAYSLVQAGLREPPVSSMWGKLFKDAAEQRLIRYRRHIRSPRPGRRGGACAVWKGAA